SDFDRSSRQRQPRHAGAVKIICFEWPLAANETIIRVHPCVFRRISTAIFTGDEDTRGRRLIIFIQNSYRQRTGRSQVFPFDGDDLRLFTARNLQRPQRNVPTTIRNERDALPIRRPARIDVVGFSIGYRKRLAPFRWHEPELVPLLTEVRSVDQPFSVGRKIWARLPSSLFIMDFMSRRAKFGLHSPKTASAVNMVAI